jgi:hypothetical protein
MIPMTWGERLETLDNRAFSAELRKKYKENKGIESIYAIIGLVLMGDIAKGNDPCMLDSKSQLKKTYEIHGRRK